MDDEGRRRSRSRRARPGRHAPVGDLLRRGGPRRRSRGCTAGSTSRPTTSPAGSSGRSAASRPGRWPSATSPGTGIPDVAIRARPTRRRRGRLLAGVVAVVVLAVVGGAFARSRLGPGATPTAALGPPHFVDETSTSGIDHVYDGDFDVLRRRRRRRVRLRRRRQAGRCTSRAAANPAALYRNASARRRAAPVRGRRRPGDRPRPASPAPTRSTSTATASSTSRSCGVGENVLLRGLGDCRFERANEALGFDGGDRWTTAFSATWEGPARAADARVRQLPRARAGRVADERLRRPRARSGPTAGRHRLRRADRPRARLLHAVDAVQRLGPLRAARPADQQRPPLLPRRRGAALADRARTSSRGSTPTPTAGS